MPEKTIHSMLRETFPPGNKEKWKQIASQEIEGKTPDEFLSWNSEDDIRFFSYYDSSDQIRNNFSEKFRLTVAGDDYFGPAKWLNIPVVTVTSENAANQIALQHLTNGADGILFKIGHQVAVQALLKNIDWKYCSLFFAVANTDNFQHELLNYLKEEKIAPEDLSGGLVWNTAVNAEGITAEPGALKNIISIDSSTSVTEIVKALSLGVDCIEKFQSDKRVAKSIGFSVEVNQHFLESIAKLKSLRFLWFQVLRAYGINDFEPNQLFIHARSDQWINERFQPHGNMLKATTSCMASVIGGADAISVIPEDEQNAMMVRTARNILSLLREESNFDKVADPSAGAYAISEMINKISAEAWKKFQENQKA